jgi:hypothetical protein
VSIVLIIVLVGVAKVVVVNLLVRRKGYAIPGKTMVRCNKGHLFTTTWIEGGSLKAIRLGPSPGTSAAPSASTGPSFTRSKMKT